jgi:hypothetical protein
MVGQLNFMEKPLQEQKSTRCFSWLLKGVYKPWRLFVTLFAAYLLTYCVLTMNGAYGPSAFGLQGILAYQWAPMGFYTENAKPNHIGRWNAFMLRSFYPLWYTDIHCFHKVSFDGKNPASP